MIIKLEPKDVVVLHPNALKGITLKSKRDKRLIEALEWGYSLHPELRINVGAIGETRQKAVIVWPKESNIDSDIVAAISTFTVPPNLPIAGLAEHLIGFRRLLSATHLDITCGAAWRDGANVHIKNLLG